MERLVRKFFDRLRGQHLSHQEKDAIRTELMAYMDAHPLSQSVVFDPPRRAVFSFFPRFAIVSTVFVLGLAVTSVLAYASESALPGDALYGMKVNFNEEVRGMLKFSSESKATWETRRAERRLEEVVDLVTLGEMTPLLEAKVDKEFLEQARKVSKIFGKLENKGKNEAILYIGMNYEASLNAHKAALEKIDSDASSGTATSTPQPFIAKINDTTKNVFEGRARAELKVRESQANQTEPSARASQGRITSEAIILQVKNSIQSQPDQAGAEAVLQKISNAEEAMKQAEEKFSTEQYGDAFSFFQQAQREAKEARIYQQIQKKIQTSADRKRSRPGADANVNISAEEGSTEQKKSAPSEVQPTSPATASSTDPVSQGPGLPTSHGIAQVTPFI